MATKFTAVTCWLLMLVGAWAADFAQTDCEALGDHDDIKCADSNFLLQDMPTSKKIMNLVEEGSDLVNDGAQGLSWSRRRRRSSQSWWSRRRRRSSQSSLSPRRRSGATPAPPVFEHSGAASQSFACDTGPPPRFCWTGTCDLTKALPCAEDCNSAECAATKCSTEEEFVNICGADWVSKAKERRQGPQAYTISHTIHHAEDAQPTPSPPCPPCNCLAQVEVTSKDKHVPPAATLEESLERKSNNGHGEAAIKSIVECPACVCQLN